MLQHRYKGTLFEGKYLQIFDYFNLQQIILQPQNNSTRLMVQCYSCSVQLSGSWALNYSGYNNGTYTGVQAYFAYSGVDWIYCFCQTCYGNGKFASLIKQWYAGPIKTIIQEEVEKVKITFEQSLKTKQKLIKQLELKLKMSDILAKIVSQESKCQIVKTQQYYKQIEKSLKITPKQYITQLSIQVNSLIKKHSAESVQFLKIELIKIKSQCEKDLQKLKVIEDQTLNHLKSAKSCSNQNLFQDQEIQSYQKIFASKRAVKEEKLKQVIRVIEAG